MARKRIPPFPAKVRERAVRRVFEQEREQATRWAAIFSVAGKIGFSGETPCTGCDKLSATGITPWPDAVGANG